MHLHQAPSSGGLPDVPPAGLRGDEPAARAPARFTAGRVARFLRSVARGITTDCSFDPTFTDALTLPGLRDAVRSRWRRPSSRPRCSPRIPASRGSP